MCIFIRLFIFLLTAVQPAVADVTTIAFGSCLRQWKPVPILDTARKKQPDVFIFAGDNVYSDSGPYRFRKAPGRIAQAYRELAARPEFLALRSSTTLLATWDDHDYGLNNAGSEFRWKNEAKSEFVKFFAASVSPQVRNRPGVYSVHYLGQGAARIQILLLDTRTFRSPLREGEITAECPRSRLLATDDKSTTLLGERQWRWLADQLNEPAALRLIVSSIQVIPDQHCYEKWGNFPHERQRLFSLLREAGARRTIFISGDRHLGEISSITFDAGAFRLYEVTASGLNSAGAGFGEVNPYRVTDDNVRVDHFGVIRYLHTAQQAELLLYGIDGNSLQRYTVNYN